jgi:hypothetical protein
VFVVVVRCAQHQKHARSTLVLAAAVENGEEAKNIKNPIFELLIGLLRASLCVVPELTVVNNAITSLLYSSYHGI